MSPKRPKLAARRAASARSSDRDCLTPPNLPRAFVARERLNRWLRGPLPATVVVRAPAWFGKTSLLRDWYGRLSDRGMPCLWISGGEITERTPPLAALLQDAELPTASPGRQQGRSRLRSAIFIDDVSYLSPSTTRELTHLLRVTSESTLFVLSTRGELPVELSNAWIRGSTLEFTQDDLAIDHGDAVAMAAAEGTTVDADALREIVDRTAGWTAAARLLMSSGAENERTLQLLERFIEEHVLASLPEAMTVFLESIAVLDTLSIDSCKAVTDDDDAGLRLHQLSSAGAFIQQDRGSTDVYRLNPIFRSVLRRRLRAHPSRWHLAHRRANAWCTSRHLVEEAIHHGSESGDMDLHATTLERYAEDMVYRGRIQMLEGYAKELPHKRLQSMPYLLLVLAWWRSRQYRFGEADDLLELARAAQKHGEKSGKLSRHQRAELAAIGRHRELTLRSIRDTQPISDKECEQMIDAFADTGNAALQVNLYSQLFSSYRRQFRLPEVFKLESKAIDLARRCGKITFTPWLYTEIGASHAEAGHILAARKFFEKGLEDASAFAEVKLGLSALSGLYLADMYYEANDRDTAEKLIAQHLPGAMEFGLVDQLVVGYVVKARLYVSRSEVDQALITLEEGSRFADERQLVRLHRCLQGEKIRILSSIGSRRELEETIPDLDATGKAVLPESRVEHRDIDSEIHDAARARLLLSLGRHSEALRLSNGWISYCTDKLAHRTLVRWQLIRAHALLLSGDVQHARRSLREALIHATRGGFFRKIADAAAPVRDLLLESYQSLTTPSSEVELFARKVIDLIQRPRPGRVSITRPQSLSTLREESAMSSREREIISLVSGGLQNREIAARLGITEGTVKWYMQQIFTKLGVRRRAQAVALLRVSGRA